MPCYSFLIWSNNSIKLILILVDKKVYSIQVIIMLCVKRI